MITLMEYYMGRDLEYYSELVDPLPNNASLLLVKVNQLLQYFGHFRKVTSGWRPKDVQAKVNPKAMGSKHVTCDAIDLEDFDGKLKEWCVFNQDIVERLGLYMEHPIATPSWVHLQQVAPRSGKTIFNP